ncbi:hypothetical protein BV22DRAFT_330112 [Leucogyrophana mollusca]|uniref:Uncharacterized protein n=1 Tax=Leucogyrophana mollusca TaxID=85980 RepID=A0ACB8BNQ5_9AGAM|nr:hypothetical protein BV22DRAFT_330112 [Leucogyrophana mollusca]
MAFDDEHADILGGPILQSPSRGYFQQWSEFSLFFKGSLLVGLGLLVWLLSIRAREELQKWRELGYRKAMRRKYGIPDADCRPFAVAYAAATRARAEREAQERSKHQQDTDQPPAPGPRNALRDTQELRRRFAGAAAVAVPDRRSPVKRAPSGYDQKRADIDPLNFADRYNSSPRVDIVEPVQYSPPRTKASLGRSSRKNLFLNGNLPLEDTKKRSWDEASDPEPEPTKKSRVDGGELTDGDENAGRNNQSSGQARPSRGSKREFVSEDDEDLDDEGELHTIPRGKKRDRAEAGSTFGGDDEDDAAESEKASRRRKRRTVPKRKSEAHSRSKKRDREAGSPDSDGEGGGGSDGSPRKGRSSRKKRDKKAMSEESHSDVSMDGSHVSKDPLCKGRKIGEEWEAGGVQYKVGSNGEHLRLTLVKKARNKYPMPKDSQHPDRSANMEIYVETWMTEEQYKAAEERQELVWQDTPRPSAEPQTPSDVPDSPTKTGKTLLWDLTKDSPAPNRRFRQSIATSAGLRINPFQQSQAAPSGRRVASSNIGSPAVFANTAGSPTRRVFSKWEKQDLEAEAMARMRAKMQEQKKAGSPLGKTSELAASATAPELGAKPPTVPIITLTPPSAPSSSLSFQKQESKPTQPSETKATPASFSFGPAPITADTSKVSAQTKEAETITSVPAFSLPPAVNKTSTSFSLGTSQPASAPSQPAVSSAPTSFSFAQPPKQPNTASAPASSAPAVPNFFAIKPSTGASTASFGGPNTEQKQQSNAQFSSTTNTISVPTQSTESVKPPAFSFAKPSVPASGISAAQQPSKMASFNNPSSTSGPSPSAPAAETTTAPPKFDFGIKPKPASSAPKSTASTSAETTKSVSPAPTEGQSSGSIAPPKFSFGQPSTGSAFGSSGASSAGLPPKPADEAPKFSFGQPPAASPFTPSSNPGAPPSAPKPLFGFGSAPGGSAFGATSGGDALKKAATGENAPKPATSAPTFGGSGFGASGSIFGKSSAPAGGDTSSTSTINPGPSGVFGASTASSNPFSTTPAGSPAQTNSFSFGGVSKPLEGPKPPAVGDSSGTTKPLFSFGKKAETSAFSGFGASPAPAGSSEAKPASSPFSFGASSSSPFGQPSTIPNPTANSSTQPQSPFGKPSQPTPSTFGFTGSGFSFGQAASQNQKQQQ